MLNQCRYKQPSFILPTNSQLFTRISPHIFFYSTQLRPDFPGILIKFGTFTYIALLRIPIKNELDRISCTTAPHIMSSRPMTGDKWIPYNKQMWKNVHKRRSFFEHRRHNHLYKFFDMAMRSAFYNLMMKICQIQPFQQGLG